jgi:hypothetical protein
VLIEGSQFGPAGSAYITSVTCAGARANDSPLTSCSSDLTRFACAHRYFSTDQVTLKYNASNCSVIVPHITIQCATTRGAGARVLWVVTIAQQSSSSPSTSFAVPVISAITRPAGASIASFATLGGDTVYVSGTNFAPAGSLAQWLVTLFLTAAGTPTVPLWGCYVVTDYVEIACTMPAGRGTGFAVQISVLNQLSTASVARLAYAPPNITRFSSVPTHWTSNGGASVSVSGVNFGVGLVQLYVCRSSASITANCAQLPQVSVVIGKEQMTASPVLDANLTGAAVLWIFVVTGGQTSVPWSVPVAAPVVTEITAVSYAAMLSASSLDPGTQGCLTQVLLKAAPASWSVMIIAGQNLDVAATISVPVVLIAPSNGAGGVPCEICSLTSITAMCIANTSSSYTRNGVLTYTLGAFAVVTRLLLDVTLPPRLFSLARDFQAGVVAVPGGTTPGISAGCALLLRFDKAVTAPVNVGTKSGVDSLLSFSAQIGAAYSGVWVAPAVLRVTITAGPTSVLGTGVGLLQVNVNASAGLVAAFGISAASSTSGLLEAGSWGDVVAFTVAVRTSTQLYVTIAAPNLALYPTTLRTAYSVGSYVVSWGTSKSATGLRRLAAAAASPERRRTVGMSGPGARGHGDVRVALCVPAALFVR